ncbi:MULTISPECIES: mannose-1-phosphate guanylyltransferase/mannose-6-phosphate isomerase [unclassified Cupriavidus]|uniref:mannose-1-phosphate guanylyltransferase/mannose-6-phosphate isomerase n=1 Tax=unclassified Cupriavidus TaxID=2640874 RepID=UPI00040B7AD0|nr:MULTISPECIES: mannose-1-phosphate guanylyltransferase/mannose-6-phosphate isomerase [unclassified Cupriavidus]MBP0628098.1 mannose-1-phosphate guanylyltransferase/mannose-6-phosphate isomerase [Cupriavidus sp. AcVe19-1a]MBP0633983.1 mannose-1-phosphate guanylyltransferase/mannose-6-phosphate isomerase [Cupriavidus sp. AcVe19-6a]
MQIIPVIISGGAGTRLWPVSREAFPKPLLKLADGESLLQKTFKRATLFDEVPEVVVVTNRETFFLTRDECQEVNEERIPLGFVLEPFGRNTAGAVASAACWVRENHGEDAVMLVLPADHLIEDLDKFRAAVEAAAAAALEGRIVTFGIRPTAPETGYGYIEFDCEQGLDGVHPVVRFVEKPKLEVAEALVAGGAHLWNSGMFCFSVRTILKDFSRFTPDLLQACESSFGAGASSTADGCRSLELDAAQFKRVTDISIDYAIMEKSDRVSVVPSDMGWSDIGSWHSISELTPPDAQGNRIYGDALLHDVSNCYIKSDARVVGAVGVDNLIIVDTPDALLVANRDCTQDVKHIVGQLKKNGHDSYKIHKTAHRPWGTYTVLEESDRFKIKRIVVKPGAQLSLQMHHHRSEHWIVVSGTADVVNGEQVISLQPNQSTYIPAGHKHRLINPGVMDLVLIEVQCGEYLGEDDIVRFEDSYGRVV